MDKPIPTKCKKCGRTSSTRRIELKDNYICSICRNKSKRIVNALFFVLFILIMGVVLWVLMFL